MLEAPVSARQPLSGEMAPFDREVLKGEPLLFGSLLQIASMKPLALDAHYNRPISLSDALNYGVQNNLSIKISRESQTFYNTQFYNYLTYNLPSLSSSLSFINSTVNSETNAHSQVWSNRLTFPLFTGGNHYLFAVAQNYRRKGWRLATQISINDELLAIYKKYSTLVLNHQLLRIRIKAVELSNDQLKQKQELFQAGQGTKYDIKLAEAQVASDTQALITQQTATRQSSLDLAYELNMPLSINLIPTSIEVGTAPLIRGKPQINTLVLIAYNNRLDLREYEYFRQATARDVQIGMASLYPTVALFLAYTRSSLGFRGKEADLSGLSVTQISSFNGNNSNGTASNNALGQVASFSSGSGSGASSSANTGSASQVASSGGTPQANVQSGSIVSSGAVAPSIIAPISVGGSTTSNINGTNTASATSPGLFKSLQAGISLQWSLPNMGTGYAANMLSLRNLSRRALLQANQQLLNVENQIRADYTNAISVLGQVEYTGSLLDSNEEALRLAMVRMKAGQGTTLDFELAKNTYLNGLQAEAQALVFSKQAQAQLLHDMGVISISTLTSGFSVDNFVQRKPWR